MIRLLMKRATRRSQDPSFIITATATKLSDTNKFASHSHSQLSDDNPHPASAFTFAWMPNEINFNINDVSESKVIENPQNANNMLRERLEIPNLWKVFQRNTSLLQKIVWTIVFLISFGLFLYETIDRIQKLIEPSKSAQVKLSYEEKLYFPAVSVCPAFQFRASVLNRFVIDRFGCKNGERYCSWDFPWNMATHTETIIKSCKYKKHYSCVPGTEESGKWQRRLTSLGRCFTYEASEPVYGGGDSNGLEIEVDPLLWDRFGLATFSGIRAYVHSPSEMPLAEITGININHGSAVNFALQVKEFNRVNDVRNNPCTEDLNYKQNQCIMGCVYETTMKLANTSCGAPFMNTFQIKNCRTRKEISYFTSVFQRVVNNGTVWNTCTTECPEPCIQKTYTPITTSLGFTHTNSSMVNLTIYFTDMWVEKIKEQWDYNIEEFVSDTGGSLNLFLGASFITIIQIADCLLALGLHYVWKMLKQLFTLPSSIKVIENLNLKTGKNTLKTTGTGSMSW